MLIVASLHKAGHNRVVMLLRHIGSVDFCLSCRCMHSLHMQMRVNASDNQRLPSLPRRSESRLVMAVLGQQPQEERGRGDVL